MTPVPFTCLARLRDGARVIDVDYDTTRFDWLFGMQVVTTEDGAETMGGVGDINLRGDYVRAYYAYNVDAADDYLVLFIAKDGSSAVIGTWHYLEGVDSSLVVLETALPSSPDELQDKRPVDVLSFKLNIAG